MNDRLPSGRKHAHEDALEKAWKDISELDLGVISSELGPDAVREGRSVSIRMLDDTCVVDVASRNIHYDTIEDREVPPYLQILILHYLLGLSATPLTNRPVSFRELDGGAMYYPAFRARAIDPLVKEFGCRPELLKRTAESLGAEPLDMGHVSFRLHFFDKVPVSVVFWLGDSEVSASVSMLFDASANKILPTEDLTVVGGVTSRTLIKRSRQ